VTPRSCLLLAVLLCGAPAATIRAQAPAIRAIEIERQDIFDTLEARGGLQRLGNALHARTRAGVVERELLLTAGEPFDSALAAETARNLRALGIFRRVQLDTAHTDSGVIVRVTTRDGWSTRPYVRFSSVAGQSDYTLGVTEENLLGTAATASLRYRGHPDRRSLLALFRQPRLFARSVSLGAAYEHRSDGRSASFSLGRPFLSLAARSAVSLDLIDFDGDVLRFREGAPAPATVLRRRFSLARVEAARALSASSRGFVRAGLTAQLRRDDFADRAVPGAVPGREVTSAAGGYVRWYRTRYLILRNVRSFLREEDFDIGSGVRFGALAAPRAFGYERDGAGLELSARLGVATPGGFVLLSGAANGRYDGAGLDSGTVRLGASALAQPAPAHAFTVQASGGWQRRPIPGDEFDLGLGTGPRAFPAHAFTGDRYVNLALEYRWTVAEDLWRFLGVGVAAFAEHGGAWFAGSPPRRGSDLGAGLLLGPGRTSGGEVVRLDLAWRPATDRLRAGWVLVVGREASF
jgi:hypothetical protein